MVQSEWMCDVDDRTRSCRKFGGGAAGMRKERREGGPVASGVGSGEIFGGRRGGRQPRASTATKLRQRLYRAASSLHRDRGHGPPGHRLPESRPHLSSGTAREPSSLRSYRYLLFTISMTPPLLTTSVFHISLFHHIPISLYYCYLLILFSGLFPMKMSTTSQCISRCNFKVYVVGDRPIVNRVVNLYSCASIKYLWYHF